MQLTENIEVTRNNYRSNEVLGRSDNSLEEGVEEFIKSHNVKISLPIVGDLTLDSRSLDNEEIDLKLNFNSGRAVEGKTLYLMI